MGEVLASSSVAIRRDTSCGGMAGYGMMTWHGNVARLGRHRVKEEGERTSEQNISYKAFTDLSNRIYPD